MSNINSQARHSSGCLYGKARPLSIAANDSSGLRTKLQSPDWNMHIMQNHTQARTVKNDNYSETGHYMYVSLHYRCLLIRGIVIWMLNSKFSHKKVF